MNERSRSSDRVSDRTVLPISLYYRTRDLDGEVVRASISAVSAPQALAVNASIRHLAPYHNLVHGMLRSTRGDNKVCSYSQEASCSMDHDG